LVELRLATLTLPLTFEINSSESFLGPSTGIPEVRALKSIITLYSFVYCKKYAADWNSGLMDPPPLCLFSEMILKYLKGDF